MSFGSPVTKPRAKLPAAALAEAPRGGSTLASHASGSGARDRGEIDKALRQVGVVGIERSLDSWVATAAFELAIDLDVGDRHRIVFDDNSESASKALRHNITVPPARTGRRPAMPREVASESIPVP